MRAVFVSIRVHEGCICVNTCTWGLYLCHCALPFVHIHLFFVGESAGCGFCAPATICECFVFRQPLISWCIWSVEWELMLICNWEICRNDNLRNSCSQDMHSVVDYSLPPPVCVTLPPVCVWLSPPPCVCDSPPVCVIVCCGRVLSEWVNEMGKEGHRDARRDLGIVKTVLSWLRVWVDVIKFIHPNQKVSQILWWFWPDLLWWGLMVLGYRNAWNCKSFCLVLTNLNVASCVCFMCDYCCLYCVVQCGSVCAHAPV